MRSEELTLVHEPRPGDASGETPVTPPPQPAPSDAALLDAYSRAVVEAADCR